MPPQEFFDYENHKIIINLIKNKFTGCISMTPDNRKLFFEAGNLVYAHSDMENESFSTILCEMGVLDLDALEKIKGELEPGQSLGKKLRMMGCADAQSLARALKQQIMRIVNRTVNQSKGEYEVLPGDLPDRIPKLKIRTLPLFIKSFLMIENPTFPEEVNGELVFERTESFDVLVDELNLPANYFEALDLMGASRTLEDINEATDLDFYQIRRLAYSLSLLKMGVLREAQPALHDTPLFVAPNLPIEAEPLDSEEGPEEHGSEEIVKAETAIGEEDQREEPVAEAIPIQPSSVADEEKSPIFAAVDGRESMDGPLELDKVIPLDRSIDEPLADLAALADILARPGREEPSGPKSLHDFEEYAEERPEDQEDQQDQETPAVIESDSEVGEDPVEALNRALHVSESLSPTEKGFDVPEFNDDNETVPGSPVPEFLEGKPTDLTAQEPRDALSEYAPGDVFEEDGSVTAPVPLEDIPDVEEPDSDPRSVRPGIEHADANSLEEMGFILPDKQGDEKQEVKRSSGYWKWLLVSVVVLVGVAGVVFKDLWWPSVSGILGLGKTEPVVQMTDTEPADVDAAVHPGEATEGEPWEETAPVAADGTFGDEQLTEEDGEEISNQVVAQEENKQPQDNEAQKPESNANVPEQDSSVAETLPAKVSTVESKTDEREAYVGLAQESVQALQRGAGKFSIAFVVACEIKTLDQYFKGRSDPDLRLLPRKIKNRDCFIGIWGIYPSQEAAHAALTSIPEYLTASGEQPWVLNLTQYL